MPPRLPWPKANCMSSLRPRSGRLLIHLVGLIRLCDHPSPLRAFSSSTYKAKSRDTYSKAQKKAHAAALQSRIKKHQESQERGDPVRGIQTEFVRSFSDPASVRAQETKNEVGKEDAVAESTEDTKSFSSTPTLNYRIPAERLEEQLQNSRQLSFTPHDPTYIPPDAEAGTYNEKIKAALEEDLEKDR